MNREPGSRKSAHTASLDIRVPDPYDLALTSLSHGWVNLQPYSWDESSRSLHRIEPLDASGRVAELSVRQPDRSCVTVLARCESPLSASDCQLIVNRMTRALRLDEDTTEVRRIAASLDADIAALLAAGGGRLLRGATLFEDVVKTLFTTNASWRLTQYMAANFVRMSVSRRTFPSPAELLSVTERRLRDDVRCGYRAKYLLETVRLFSDGIECRALCSGKLPGLGEYGMRHVRMLLGDYSEIPLDSEVRSFCKEHLGCRTDRDMQSHFETWGDYRFLGYKLSRQAQHLNWIGA